MKLVLILIIITILVAIAFIIVYNIHHHSITQTSNKLLQCWDGSINGDRCLSNKKPLNFSLTSDPKLNIHPYISTLSLPITILSSQVEEDSGAIVNHAYAISTNISLFNVDHNQINNLTCLVDTGSLDLVVQTTKSLEANNPDNIDDGSDPSQAKQTYEDMKKILYHLQVLGPLGSLSLANHVNTDYSLQRGFL